VAWTIQPYMAAVAAILALGMWEVSRPVVPHDWMRAAAAALASASALLLGYALWGGIKEIVTAALVVTAAGLVPAAIAARSGWREAVPLGIVAAAIVVTLSVGGVVWLVPILAGALALAVVTRGAETALPRAAQVAAVGAALALPALLAAGRFPPSSSDALTNETELGNLIEPLHFAQIVGIWPTGDFRVDPADGELAAILIAIAVIGAAIGVWVGLRERAVPFLLFVAGVPLAGLVIYAIGSPWVDAKALASASPAVLLAALAGAGALYLDGRRVEGGLLGAAVALGILWSAWLAYRDVSLAPRDQLAELERIGERYSGDGPALMTEYQPYGVRHFLRELDPEGASELRRRAIPLADGSQLEKSAYADTDRISLPDLLIYRTLVLRRSPAQSRPPLSYRLVDSERYYEVWQREPGAPPVRDHLGLGGDVEPTAAPACADVRALAAAASPGDRIVAAARPGPIVVPLAEAAYPAAWAEVDPSFPVPREAGTLSATVDVAEAGTYDVWLGGSLRQEGVLRVDGREVGSVRHVLNNSGQYMPLGTIPLSPGRHRVEVEIGGAGLLPGSHGTAGAIGPLVLSRGRDAERTVSVAPAQASRLCGRRWDWIELVPASLAAGA
jgi:hypothetical protein